jgi:putative tricarboxylic transport membrane protein
LGYFLKKLDIPMAPIVLTFVLCKLLENTLLQLLMYFKGNYFGFFMRPISGTLLVLAVIMFGASVISAIKGKRNSLADDAEL